MIVSNDMIANMVVRTVTHVVDQGLRNRLLYANRGSDIFSMGESAREMLMIAASFSFVTSDSRVCANQFVLSSARLVGVACRLSLMAFRLSISTETDRLVVV